MINTPHGELKIQRGKYREAPFVKIPLVRDYIRGSGFKHRLPKTALHKS